MKDPFCKISTRATHIGKECEGRYPKWRKYSGSQLSLPRKVSAATALGVSQRFSLITDNISYDKHYFSPNGS